MKVTSTSTITHGFNSGTLATKEVMGRGLGALASCIGLAYRMSFPSLREFDISSAARYANGVSQEHRLW